MEQQQRQRLEQQRAQEEQAVQAAQAARAAQERDVAQAAQAAQGACDARAARARQAALAGEERVRMLLCDEGAGVRAERRAAGGGFRAATLRGPGAACALKGAPPVGCVWGDSRGRRGDGGR